MPARRPTSRSGTKVLAHVATRGGAAQALRHRMWTPDNDTTDEDRPAARGDQPLRRSSSFTAPLRESFFDLAQRYHRLREAAFHKSKPAPKSLPPPIPLVRERRLTDLPPPAEESVTESVFADRFVEEAPEEETLVQPLARRPSDAPPASERRQFTTVRPPPPPDPLPRILPSTAPLALATVPPPPVAPPPSIWRPMLVTAAMSATIGAIVSVGIWAVRTPAAAEKASAELATTTTVAASPTATNTIGPCPIPTTSLASANTPSSSSGNASVTGSHASSPAPHEVSLDALPVETTSRGAAAVAPVLRAPAPAPAPTHIAHLDLTEHASKRVASEPARAAPERASVEAERPSRRARKGKAEASASEEEAAITAAGTPEPAPTPTAGPDRAAIAKAVGRAAASASSCDASPQSGRAQITFAPSGNVASVQLIEPFSDNAVNGCVLRALGRAHVPPFTGEPVIVRKSLNW